MLEEIEEKLFKIDVTKTHYNKVVFLRIKTFVFLFFLFLYVSFLEFNIL